MALDHRTKIYAVKEARLVKLITDVAGSPATYTGVTTAVVASPAPTTTTFSVTPAGGATLTVGRVITVGTQVAVISAIATDAITVSPALPVAPVTAQTVFQSGGFPITGCKALVITPTVTTVDLRGDNTLLDSDSLMTMLQVELDYAKFSFDVTAVMMGGTVTDSGTTPNQQTTWSLPKQPTFNYFQVEARCFSVDSPNGDLHIRFNKVKAADAPLSGFTEENYTIPKIKCRVLPPNGTTTWMDYIYNETALPVAA